MVSMIGFFFFEKCVNILGEMKESKLSKEASGDPERKLRVVREGHATSNRAIGENLCKHKYSSYCASEFENVDEKTRKQQPDLLDPTQVSMRIVK